MIINITKQLCKHTIRYVSKSYILQEVFFNLCSSSLLDTIYSSLPRLPLSYAVQPLEM